MSNVEGGRRRIGHGFTRMDTDYLSRRKWDCFVTAFLAMTIEIVKRVTIFLTIQVHEEARRKEMRWRWGERERRRTAKSEFRMMNAECRTLWNNFASQNYTEGVFHRVNFEVKDERGEVFTGDLVSYFLVIARSGLSRRSSQSEDGSDAAI